MAVLTTGSSFEVHGFYTGSKAYLSKDRCMIKNKALNYYW